MPNRSRTCPDTRTSAPPDPSHGVAKPRVPLAAVAAVACVAQFMVVLDSSIVNVALPSMKTGLGLSASAQQWVVNGYLVAFGGLLLFAARASDLFGRRRTFHIGLVVFSLASLAGGLAQDGWMLLAARVVQGAGAAALAPSSLSLITASHTEPDRRTRAMTWWGVAASSAGAAGIVVGGLLAQLSWRWVMLVNVPIGAGLLIAGLMFLAPTATGRRRSHIDLPGAITVTLSAGALVHGVSAAPDAGWGTPRVIVSLAAGLLLLAAFVAIERRSSDPLVPPGILSLANVRMGNILTLCMGAVLTAPLFFLSLYLQQVLGQSAVRTGLSLLPMVAVISIGVLLSQKLIPRVGARRLVGIGGAIAAAGLAWLGRIPVHSDYVAHVLLPTVVVAAGTSLTMMPAIVASTSGIAPRNAGVASGLLNMCRQLGAALGLAVLVTIATTVTSHSTGSGNTAVVDGYRIAFYALAALSLVTAVLAQRLKPAQDTTAAANPSDTG
ncbi:drug resistance transporter, EmrB/QacA subfamily [Actinacidiphila yanglinensis]|uniref:Drug resistance transporter, EmrB/QacA subfamily n=1 Tax=Actinacidiphila yanglinensis TaxID=310779 RepID=A0A1H6DHM6_9ACTN|nr:MFS transporter [Actinacidiphila yanglinensis]SEG84313.1 drug resistance transporter, EmrB/QacA subfamily [Actinacidiphila yanglinensis]